MNKPSPKNANRGAGEQVYTLKGADQPFRIIVEAMSEAAITVSLDGTILYCNRRFAELVQSPLERVIGSPFENFVLVKHRAIFRTLCTERGKARFEIALRSVDGATIPVQVSSSRVTIDNCPAICLIATDLTEQKRQEALINEERGRNEERMRANDQLAAMGMTAAALAHEIANPLQWIFTMVQLMQRELAKSPQGELGSWSEHLASMHQEINRLSAMLQEFRSLARPMNLNVTSINLGDFIGEVENVILGELEGAGVSVTHDLSPELPLLEADGEKLKQVFVNLYKNAIEAMPSGGTLTVKAYLDGDNVTIEFSDTGIGIGEGVDVFQPFITTKATGTGLGLMVVRQILAEHGGSISYSSKPGDGTTFHVVLPRRRQDVSEQT